MHAQTQSGIIRRFAPHPCGRCVDTPAGAALWRSFACCASSVERRFSPRAQLINKKAPALGSPPCMRNLRQGLFGALRLTPGGAAGATLWRSFACCASSVERGFSPRAHLINKKAPAYAGAFLFIGGESVRAYHVRAFPNLSADSSIHGAYSLLSVHNRSQKNPYFQPSVWEQVWEQIIGGVIFDGQAQPQASREPDRPRHL